MTALSVLWLALLNRILDTYVFVCACVCLCMNTHTMYFSLWNLHLLSHTYSRTHTHRSLSFSFSLSLAPSLSLALSQFCLTLYCDIHTHIHTVLLPWFLMYRVLAFIIFWFGVTAWFRFYFSNFLSKTSKTKITRSKQMFRCCTRGKNIVFREKKSENRVGFIRVHTPVHIIIKFGLKDTLIECIEIFDLKHWNERKKRLS